MKIPSLISVEALPMYRLRLQFDDNTTGLVDLSNLAGKGIFSAWDEDNLFSRPYINEMGTVAWNELIDIDLLNAYLTIKNTTFEAWKQDVLSHASD
ncbi:DUF2442 domain-containing protein [Spirosoma panaciterrae]|uniref:DUF2442 domain-containing protein n=1 Tax=Spirosoma panaciterrae TaxID=496058 RepID=UPI00036E6FE0|nr:DUF2442 domain-containing protein [Spirosoma panaciterrae]